MGNRSVASFVVIDVKSFLYRNNYCLPKLMDWNLCILFTQRNN